MHIGIAISVSVLPLDGPLLQIRAEARFPPEHFTVAESVQHLLSEPRGGGQAKDDAEEEGEEESINLDPSDDEEAAAAERAAAPEAAATGA